MIAKINLEDIVYRDRRAMGNMVATDLAKIADVDISSRSVFN